MTVDEALRLLEEIKTTGLRLLLKLYVATGGGAREASAHEVIAAGVPPSTLSIYAEKLQRLGLAEKLRRDRSYAIRLTERGKRLAEALLSAVE
jgi:DNA-binding MarR family transcriptional regulator